MKKFVQCCFIVIVKKIFIHNIYFCYEKRISISLRRKSRGFKDRKDSQSENNVKVRIQYGHIWRSFLKELFVYKKPKQTNKPMILKRYISYYISYKLFIIIYNKCYSFVHSFPLRRMAEAKHLTVLYSFYLQIANCPVCNSLNIISTTVRS